MIAWYGEQNLKDEVMRRLRDDIKMDRLVRGEYWDGVQGCQLGCLTRKLDGAHEAMERLFAIPRDVARLLEFRFEYGTESDATEWVLESTDAIPVGADLSLAVPQLMHWLLGPESPSGKFNGKAEIVAVRDLFARRLAGDDPTAGEWQAAYAAAYAAATASASAYAAAYAAASESASAAEAAAAYKAAHAAESAAAYKAAVKSIGEEFLRILRACPVVATEATDTEAVAETMLHLSTLVEV